MSDASEVEIIQPGTDLDIADGPHVSAIEAAARAALETPGIPGRDEFMSLAMQARIMSMSGLVPKSLQGKPHDVMVVLLTGRDLGIPVTAATRKVYVIDGQPSIAPQLKAALVRRQGLGRIVAHPDNSDRWWGAVPLGPDGRQMGPMTVFTWADAQRAGLVREDCQPDAHSDPCNRITKNRERGACKSNWRTYPQRSGWWRAVGYCADDNYPEVALGLYSPDELGSVTDEDGRPIDPGDVDLPEGFGPRGQTAPPPETPADPDELWELQSRVLALPDEFRAELRQTWESTSKLAGRRLYALDPTGAKICGALVTGLENRAEAGGWDKAVARDVLTHRLAVVIEEIKGGHPDDEPEPDEPEPEVPTIPHDVAEAPPEAPSIIQGLSEEEEEAKPPPKPPVDSETPSLAHEVSSLMGQMEARGDGKVGGELSTWVQALHHAKVDAQLRARELDEEGPIDSRRLRLVAAMLREYLATPKAGEETDGT